VDVDTKPYLFTLKVVNLVEMSQEGVTEYELFRAISLEFVLVYGKLTLAFSLEQVQFWL
jgi:hypothetical protein